MINLSCLIFPEHPCLLQAHFKAVLKRSGIFLIKSKIRFWVKCVKYWDVHACDCPRGAGQHIAQYKAPYIEVQRACRGISPNF